jgi:hypothetical protein
LSKPIQRIQEHPVLAKLNGLPKGFLIRVLVGVGCNHAHGSTPDWVANVSRHRALASCLRKEMKSENVRAGIRIPIG